MTSSGKRGLVPKLRFPEFQEAGDWEAIPLSQLAKRCTQKNSGGVLNRVLTNSAEFGVVDQRDYFDKDIANQDNLAGYFIVKKGDYVYNPRISTTAPVGPISKNNIETGVTPCIRFSDSTTAITIFTHTISRQRAGIDTCERHPAPVPDTTEWP